MLSRHALPVRASHRVMQIPMMQRNSDAGMGLRPHIPHIMLNDTGHSALMQSIAYVRAPIPLALLNRGGVGWHRGPVGRTLGRVSK
jgi:hypothetical protein